MIWEVPANVAGGPEDPRWDSPLFRMYEAHELEVEKNRRGVMEPRYPHAWKRCTLCGGAGRRRRLLRSDAIGPVFAPCHYCFGEGSIKDLVRALAGHRCIRCGHPYRKGQEQFWSEPAEEGTTVEAAALQLFEAEPTDEPRVKRERPVHWSPCDAHCTHGGLTRTKRPGEPVAMWTPSDDSDGDEELVRDALGAGYEVQAAWRILTVHHADEDKANGRWWNLLALCQRCRATFQCSRESRWTASTRGSTLPGSVLSSLLSTQ